MPPRVSGEVLENARFPIFYKRLLQAQAYNIKIKVNPNTTFYSYYFFPRAPRSDFEVLFLSFFLRGWKSDESDMSDRSDGSDRSD